MHHHLEFLEQQIANLVPQFLDLPPFFKTHKRSFLPDRTATGYRVTGNWKEKCDIAAHFGSVI
jgi:hypothetical protein